MYIDEDETGRQKKSDPKLEKAVDDLFDDMLAQGIEPTAVTYSILLKFYLPPPPIDLNPSKISKIILMMRYNNLEPNSFFFSNIFTAFLDRSQVDLALSFVAQMCGTLSLTDFLAKNRKTQIPKEFFNLLGHIYSRKGKLDEVKVVFDEMKKRGINGFLPRTCFSPVLTVDFRHRDGFVFVFSSSTCLL